MKTKLLQRVLWLMIPLLTLFNPIVWASNTTTASDPAPAGTYVAMASSEAVVAGDTIIVVYEGGTKAMSTTQNSNNRGYIAVTISNTTPKTISLNGTTTVQALAVAASSNSGWTLYTGVGYLYAPNYNSGTNNYLRTDDTGKDGYGGNWTISYNSMVAAGSGTRRNLLYNTNNNIFSCYASNAQNTQAITVYKKAHSVTYKANGGATTCSDATLYKSNATVTVCATEPTRANYNFTGWTATIALTNASTSATIAAGSLIPAGTQIKMPAKHVVLTAQWESAVTSYTVTYNANGKDGGGAAPTDASTYSSGATVTVLGNPNSMTRTGCTFSGWNTEADGSGTTYAENATFSISADMTLYAKWAATVTWNDNGGVIRTDNIFVPAAGKSVTPPSDPSTSARGNCGDKFIGWTTTADYQANTPSPGDIVTGAQTVTGSTDYYAVFADYAD